MEVFSGSLRKVAAIMIVVVMVGVRVEGEDPDLLTDFDLSSGATIDGNFFTFKGFNGVGSNSTASGSFKITRATQQEFPGLMGLGVSYAFFEIGANSVVPPHYHPRASELHMILEGSLTVAFVDTTNKLFNKTLFAGDTFVFPKGMVHYQINLDMYKPVLAISAFGSASPGTVLLPSTLFGSGIADLVLQKSFMISPETLSMLKAPFL
ncbi:putative germin-like protein 9-2 [Cryptomeria japonica]|uniref:putative germin-like protein 9-2 n=1 Tax=Cryptomeria japonica TaxID=3369 RepID=UPI0025AD5DB1|nr:putative germin-like protein 9-2 [Cryptomeria japonica]